MAISTLCYLSSTKLPRKELLLTVPRTPPVLTCKAHSPYFPIHSLSSKSKCYLSQLQNTAFMRQLIAPKSQTKDQGGRTVGFSDFISKWVGLIRSVLPGGSLWSLIDHKEEKTTTGKPVTLFFALCRMWALLEDDKWVIFVALVALSVAAVRSSHCYNILCSWCLSIDYIRFNFQLFLLFLFLVLYFQLCVKFWQFSQSSMIITSSAGTRKFCSSSYWALYVLINLCLDNGINFLCKMMTTNICMIIQAKNIHLEDNKQYI